MNYHPQEEYEIRESIKKSLDSISSVKSDTLLSIFSVVEIIDELSVPDFPGGEDFFLKQIQKDIKSLKDVNLNLIPIKIQRSLEGKLNNIIKLFSTINKHKNKTEEAVPISELSKKLRETYEDIEAFSQNLFVRVFVENNDLEKRDKKLTALISSIESREEYSKRGMERQRKEVRKMVEEIRLASSQVVVIKYAEVFKNEYEEHLGISKKWLNYTIGLLIVIFVAGIGFWLFMGKGISNSNDVVNYTITKVLVLTILFYSLSICIRNYKAHQHNYILNKHRYNALQTFELFTKSTRDTAIKDAVLMEVCRTIFSNQQTGYINSGNDNDSPNKIIEIIKNTVSQK